MKIYDWSDLVYDGSISDGFVTKEDVLVLREALEKILKVDEETFEDDINEAKRLAKEALESVDK